MQSRYSLIVMVFAATIMSCQSNNDQAGNEEQKAEQEHVHDQAQSDATPAKKPLSPHTASMANIGGTHVHIDYSSPGVRGRVIWGGLVPYDRVWAAGAHNATWVEFYGDVKVQGNNISKGKYALFAIPGKDKWTIILNENFSQHLTDDYDQALDVLRVEVTPEIVEDFQESLTWSVQESDGSKGAITFGWEHIRFAIPIEEA